MLQYVKLFVAAVGTVLVALIPVLSTGHTPTTAELLNVAVIGVNALMVFASPNTPGAQYTKFILSALSAGLVALVTLVGAGSLTDISVAGWLQVVVAAGVAVGVFTLPNQVRAAAMGRSMRSGGELS